MASECDLSGWVLKRGGGWKKDGKVTGIKKWSRRFTTLKGHSLSYYSDEACTHPKGTVELRGAFPIMQINEDDPELTFLIIINTPEREFALCLSSQVLLQKWLSFIEKAISDAGSPSGSPRLTRGKSSRLVKMFSREIDTAEKEARSPSRSPARARSATVDNHIRVCGWIEKKGGGKVVGAGNRVTMSFGWKARYATLTARSLTYFEDESCMHTKGSLAMDEAVLVVAPHDPEREFRFKLVTPDRNLEFAVKTAEDHAEWTEAIEKVLAMHH
eukprot:TRINITY_DN15271_c0_g1::TRINITY_DN15271_c0_g1_i1::g.30768::m.30768 TRINITY_DN15271_c0_g1::TRINITY_DN15271_c0_g1_i1::g.30768  ORF type:complete len:272 (+),score=52.52,sp/Q8BYW1/RHG25_MOUSE/29.09/4e-06,PH/PF00169.24/2e-08,PH/PF00169.24/1.6e-10,PH_8/PF15409.1/0.022,PH_8/PF15409.1/0.17,PH_11/PF15413.1/0.98,PH_11/PF15413.1/0.016,PH_3/PF14593.1/21,PH_3/PF14593.1/0.0016,Mcp5_PH/PF12814.2/36,Mcp5_PH/PF12814.2/0.037,PH_2/PF08458.5/1.1e+02,PH_2/PF08458.5/0.048 TRINITY_DN15271_c0_g1_i1:47-862(+)